VFSNSALINHPTITRHVVQFTTASSNYPREIFIQSCALLWQPKLNPNWYFWQQLLWRALSIAQIPIIIWTISNGYTIVFLALTTDFKEFKIECRQMGSSVAGGVQNSIRSDRLNAVYPWKGAALISTKSFHLITQSPSAPWNIFPANTRETRFNSKGTPVLTLMFNFIISRRNWSRLLHHYHLTKEYRSILHSIWMLSPFHIST
jgi:hypothetical protein